MTCRACGAPERSCSATTHFTDSGYLERHCHACRDMLMEACQIAGFRFIDQSSTTPPVCTCWMIPITDEEQA